jgi:hypothetical protein
MRGRLTTADYTGMLPAGSELLTPIVLNPPSDEPVNTNPIYDAANNTCDGKPLQGGTVDGGAQAVTDRGQSGGHDRGVDRAHEQPDRDDREDPVTRWPGFPGGRRRLQAGRVLDRHGR